MKLGGLTWWRYNYGSILQAYALQEELNSRDDVNYEILCQYGKKIASASNLKDKLKRYGVMATIKRIVWKFGLKRLRNRNRKIQAFVDEYLRVSEEQYSSESIADANTKYDGFVCGSDQIWNPELVGMDSIYWLGFAETGKLKFSYAPSVGVDKFSDSQRNNLIRNLRDFKAISAREESSAQLINAALGAEKCVTVLDPTLLVEKDMWDNLSTKRMINEPYMFVYMLRGTKIQRQFIEKVAKKLKLKIVTMPFLDTEKIEIYDFVFGDYKIWDADPAEFISLIRYADFVMTDSFHSMVFSCIYHRPFYTFPKIGKAQINRVRAFQQMLGLEDRMLDETRKIDNLLTNGEIDWERVDAVIRQKREFSQKYLDSVFI